MILTTERFQLIKQLLTKYHLNNVDRKIFKDNSITLSEIKHIIKLELEDTNVFPSNAKESYSIFEGYYIEKIAETKFILHSQRPQASNPWLLAESNLATYSSFDKLIYDYLDKQYKFNIDGLPINR